MKGIILNKGEEYYTQLKLFFKAIDNIQENYNWLITDYECYPENEKYAKIFNGNPVWISGKELTKMMINEDFQWIWGVLSGFEKNISKDEVFRHASPIANGYEGFWSNSISIQHLLADLEIVAWDSSLTLFISKEDKIVEKLRTHLVLAEDLQKYNM